MDGNCINTLWPQDAIQLVVNSANVKDRVDRINFTTEKLCDYLVDHPNGNYRNRF